VTASPAEARAAIRAGSWRSPTRELAPGYLQCNLVVLPADWAEDFARWCDANPRVAPVVARSDPGDPRLPALGDVDVRSDAPRYRLFRDGVPSEELDDLSGVWTDDLVAFASGCSFSLEEALRRAGVRLAYEQRGFGGAIYETTRDIVASDRFAGRLVVSMRPLAPEDVELAIGVSERHPQLHGAPVHHGDPAALGIDLERPLDAIGKVDVAPGEEPVYWACGVTPQLAIERARPPLAITHLSAHMLLTDVRLEELSRLGPDPSAPARPRRGSGSRASG
jgi:uncharacterized protein YcsI (UPF0317 family)